MKATIGKVAVRLLNAVTRAQSTTSNGFMMELEKEVNDLLARGTKYTLVMSDGKILKINVKVS